MSDYICTITQVTIHQPGDNPLTTSDATVVSLDDMSGDYCISVKQHAQGSEGCVLLDPDELPKLQEAVQILLQQGSLYMPTPERGLSAEDRAICLEVLGRE